MKAIFYNGQISKGESTETEIKIRVNDVRRILNDRNGSADTGK